MYEYKMYTVFLSFLSYYRYHPVTVWRPSFINVIDRNAMWPTELMFKLIFVGKKERAGHVEVTLRNGQSR